MISDELLRIIRCPITKSPLQLADDELLERLNSAIAEGRIKTRVGTTISRKMDAGLVDHERRHLMPIYDGIPNLIPDEAIPLDQL